MRSLLNLALACALAWSLQAQVSESPSTVAPGSFLVEVDALSLSVQREAGTRVTSVLAGSTFLTTGLTERWDIQLGADLYLRQSLDAGGLRERSSGFGDLYARTKWRFWDGGEYNASAAVLPYVKIPTNTGGVGNSSVEGGIILPFEAELLGGVLLGANAQIDLVRNAADDGYDVGLFASAYASRPLAGPLAAYAEAFASSQPGHVDEAALGIGAVWAFSEALSVDYEVMRGLTSDTADWTHTLRLVWGF